MMGARTRWAARVALAVAALTLMMGCDGAVEPTKFTTIADAKAFSSTRSDVKSIFDTAATSAIEAIEGGEIRNGDSVRAMTCGELYGKKFRELEIGGSFVTRSVGFDAVVSRVQQAWAKQGWSVELTEPDRIFLKTKTSSGVRVTGLATVQAARNDPTNVAIGLKVGTGCLKLPKSVVDGL